MLQEHTTAVLMLCAIIPGDRTNVHVNMVILEMEELAKVSLVISIYLYPLKKMLMVFITPILKSLVVPVIWLALIDAIYSRIAPFFALNRIFFPANEKATLKTKQPIRFQGLFKVTNLIGGKWKTKSIMWQILQPLFPNSCFSPPKWMNLISN